MRLAPPNHACRPSCGGPFAIVGPGPRGQDPKWVAWTRFSPTGFLTAVLGTTPRPSLAAPACAWGSCSALVGRAETPALLEGWQSVSPNWLRQPFRLFRPGLGRHHPEGFPIDAPSGILSPISRSGRVASSTCSRPDKPNTCNDRIERISWDSSGRDPLRPVNPWDASSGICNLRRPSGNRRCGPVLGGSGP